LKLILENMNIQSLIVLGTTMSLLSCGNKPIEKKSEAKPNILFILADDLGYGDVSCYGQKNFATPHIDLLAKQGTRFVRAYAGSPVCAPSRSVLLTGLTSGHTPIRGNKELMPEGQQPIPAGTVTIAEILKAQGYATSAFGKWGLGFVGTEGDPNNQGFDEFFGYNCQRQAHRYYIDHLWHNSKKVMLPGNDLTHKVTYSTDTITKAALNYLNNIGDKPFFMYLAITLPHAELLVPDDTIFKSFDGKYTEKPYVGPSGAEYGPNIKIINYVSQPKPHATFAAMVTRLDNYVGMVMEKLKEKGLDKNTLVIFTSDNGAHEEGGADPAFFRSTAGLRGIKRDLFEGGIRVPFIAVWPGKVPENTSSNQIVTFWDMMPTLSAVAGTEPGCKTDGISLLPAFLGEKQSQQHESYYWEFHENNGRQAALKGDWKLVLYNVMKPAKKEVMLFNLASDPYETTNLAKQHPEKVAELMQIINDSRVPVQSFPFVETLVKH